MKKLIASIVFSTVLLTFTYANGETQYYKYFTEEKKIESQFVLPTSMDLKSYGRKSPRDVYDVNGRRAIEGTLVSSKLSITGRDFYDNTDYHWALFDILTDKNSHRINTIHKDNYNAYYGYNAMLNSPLLDLKGNNRDFVRENSFDPHEFGEAPDFDSDAPMGDAIVPMLVLLAVFYSIKKVKTKWMN